MPRNEEAYPVEGTCKLVGDRITLKRFYKRTGKTLETEYVLTELDPHPSIGQPAYRLDKLEADGEISESYDVILRSGGWIECECKDGHCRMRECKHVKSLRKLGLLPPLPERHPGEDG